MIELGKIDLNVKHITIRCKHNLIRRKLKLNVEETKNRHV